MQQGPLWRTLCSPVGCYQTHHLQMRSGSQLCLPGTLQPLGCVERLGFRGRGVFFRQSPVTMSPTPQCPKAGLAQVPARVPARVHGDVTVFYFFTILASGCLFGAEAVVGVPGWLRYPEKTAIAQGLPPTGTKEAKPRNSAKPSSKSAHWEGLAEPGLPLPTPESALSCPGPQTESTGLRPRPSLRLCPRKC